MCFSINRRRAGRQSQLFGQVILSAGPGDRYIQAEQVALRLPPRYVFGKSSSVIVHGSDLRLQKNGYKKRKHPCFSTANASLITAVQIFDLGNGDHKTPADCSVGVYLCRISISYIQTANKRKPAQKRAAVCRDFLKCTKMYPEKWTVEMVQIPKYGH